MNKSCLYDSKAARDTIQGVAEEGCTLPQHWYSQQQSTVLSSTEHQRLPGAAQAMPQAAEELPGVCPAAVTPLVVQAAVALFVACRARVQRRLRCEATMQRHSALEEPRYQLVPACSDRATALRAVLYCDLQRAGLLDRLYRVRR